jgi:elongation factor 1-gamma
MVAGTLYTYPESFRGTKVRVTANLAGVKDLKVVEVQQSDKTHHHVPSFVSEDKKINLFEANAICFLLANEQLRGGSTPAQQAQVLQWLEYGSVTVQSAVASWVFPALSLVEHCDKTVQSAKQELKQALHCLDEHLKTRTFLVGERLTLADVSMAADILLAWQHVAEESYRKQFVNVNRWFLTVVNQPEFKKVAGEVKLCTKEAKFDAQLFAKNKQGGSKQAKEEKPKKKEDDNEDEEDDTMADEPKQNDPFATMPKGTFNMDEFKREYSNKDTKSVAIPYFWKNFDKECYSIWYCEYKYPEELNLTFMSSNLVGGMYQRIEKLRKNAFASMAVWGENKNNTIAGCWLWKGQELAFPLCPDWTTDYESYNWRKLNPEDEKDKELFNQFLLWEGDLNGKKFADGKIFK